MPRWLTGSTFYPMTEAAGGLLRKIAPRGRDMAGRLTPALTDAVREAGARDGSANPPRDLGHGRGYDARERSQIDDLVEKSR
jgi:hypothetical protein